MLKMINIYIYGWFDAISLYEHSIAKNIQSTFCVGLQIPSKFNHFSPVNHPTNPIEHQEFGLHPSKNITIKNQDMLLGSPMFTISVG
jgi:hypothetical protein